MMNQSGFFFGVNVVIVRGFVNTLLSGLHPIVGQSLRFLWWPFGDFLLEVCFFNSHNIGYPKWWALENVSPVTASPCKYGHCWYPPKFSHGTWKWHPWIGDSFWKLSLILGSVLNLRSVSIPDAPCIEYLLYLHLLVPYIIKWNVGKYTIHSAHLGMLDFWDVDYWKAKNIRRAARLRGWKLKP